jgi:murein DD-endopeptidase MepM/ murein hydrolase activator NlpD
MAETSVWSLTASFIGEGLFRQTIQGRRIEPVREASASRTGLLRKGRTAFRMRSRRPRPLLHAFLFGLIGLGIFTAVILPGNGLPVSLAGTSPVAGLSLPGFSASSTEEPVLTSGPVTETIRREDVMAAIDASIRDALGGGSGGPQLAAAEPTSTPAGPPYQFYVVQDGDTASSISGQFGIGLEYLIWNNPEVEDGSVLVPGQVLIVPVDNGIIHFVRFGETLSDIANRYSVSLATILDYPSNSFTDPDAVVENELVFVPGGSPPIVILPDPTPVPTDEPVLVTSPPTEPAPVQSGPPSSSPPAGPSSSAGLIWPAYGPISSYMDGSHPLGIDIDLYSNPNASIVASTSGRVIFAGGDPCCSYGLYVVIMSPGGIETLYAHLSRISVSVGQQVSQGQVIGNGGCTGYCTGNHLHFEVIDNGVRVNPLSYLP